MINLKIVDNIGEKISTTLTECMDRIENLDDIHLSDELCLRLLLILS